MAVSAAAVTPVALLLLALAPPVARALDTEHPGDTFEAIGRDVRRIHEANRHGLARVRTETAIGVLSGTGFFIDSEGLILTTSSLVANKDSVWIETAGAKEKAELVGIDRRSSVALLRSAARGMPLKLAPEAVISPGEPAVALGFPFSKDAAPAFGLISGIDSTSPQGRYFCATHIRADIDLAPGMTGAPLLNTRGEVIGLVTGSLDGGRHCYALPSRSLMRVVEDLRQFGRPRVGWVGISVRQDTNASPSTAFVVVRQVFTNAPAFTAGVREGDRVLRIGGRDVRQPGDIIEASFLARVGDSMALELQRGEERLTFSVPVTERPAPPPGIGLAEADSNSAALPGIGAPIHIEPRP